MLNATVLFVSNESSLIDVVKKVSQSISNLSLEVCHEIDDACSQVERNNPALILIHLPEHGDEAEVSRLLRAASERSLSVVVLSDTYRNQQAFTLLRAGAAE